VRNFKLGIVANQAGVGEIGQLRSSTPGYAISAHLSCLAAGANPE
jgi:hypothetical protein